jgi:hypothetical protein
MQHLGKGVTCINEQVDGVFLTEGGELLGIHRACEASAVVQRYFLLIASR